MTKCQITCKSLQKSSKCQNFLRVWHLVIFRADQLKKPPCMFELLIEHRAWMLKSLGTLQTRSLPLHYRGDQLLGADLWGRKGRSSRSLKKRSRSLKTRSRSLKKKSRSLKTKSRSLKKRSRKSIVKMTTPSSLCWKNFGACDAETQNTAHSPPPSLGEPFFCDFPHS